MMDCKKALVETAGNVDEAINYLRKSGIAKAEKKGDRVAKEGLVFSYIHHGGRLGVLVELNCETDFVAEGRFEKFYAESCLLEQHFIKDPDRKISDLITDAVSTLGENIVINRFSRFSVGESNQTEKSK